MDRTISDNKLENIIRDNNKGTSVLIDVAFRGDINVIKKEAEKILKYKRPHNRNSAHVEYQANVVPVMTGTTHFCYRLSQPQGHSAAGRMSMKNPMTPLGFFLSKSLLAVGLFFFWSIYLLIVDTIHL